MTKTFPKINKSSPKKDV